MKYNLQEAERREASVLVTFGGAYSNHLHAFAACKEYLNVHLVAIIRGEEPAKKSPTLEFLKNQGVELVFITRAEYADKESEEMKFWIYSKWPSAYIIPEGGGNFLGLNGAMEMVNERDKSIENWCISAGTGTTAAALLIQAPAATKVHVFAALKGKAYMENEIRNKLNWFFNDTNTVEECMERCEVYSDEYFGGYGKFNSELLNFISFMNENYELPLDVVYTSKMMFQMSRMKKPNKGSVLIFHTGGLQGNPQSKFYSI
ncbi:MAG: 1-aminocyclopropane-1-carboxylate deaminase/D-cysteine desulfhydrase [Bacteroidota bacterium]